jgi:NADH dehydrogenase FAD-containing subunit
MDNHKNIFIAGDVAQLQEEKLAQNAHRHAQIIIQNIMNLESGNSLLKYNSKQSPMIVSLGKWEGIFEYKKLVITGLIPGILKNLVEIKEMISLRYL